METQSSDRVVSNLATSTQVSTSGHRDGRDPNFDVGTLNFAKTLEDLQLQNQIQYQFVPSSGGSPQILPLSVLNNFNQLNALSAFSLPQQFQVQFGPNFVPSSGANANQQKQVVDHEHVPSSGSSVTRSEEQDLLNALLLLRSPQLFQNLQQMQLQQSMLQQQKELEEHNKRARAEHCDVEQEHSSETGTGSNAPATTMPTKKRKVGNKSGHSKLQVPSHSVPTGLGQVGQIPMHSVLHCHAHDSTSHNSEEDVTYSASGVRWTNLEVELLNLVARNVAEKDGHRHGELSNKVWANCAHYIPGKSAADIKEKWIEIYGSGRLKKIKYWSEEESDRLKMVVEGLGAGSWEAVACYLPHRTPLQCKERWHLLYDPQRKKSPFTEEEKRTFNEAVMRFGHNWKLVAEKLPGRTRTDVKNYWQRQTPFELATNINNMNRCHNCCNHSHSAVK